MNSSGREDTIHTMGDSLSLKFKVFPYVSPLNSGFNVDIPYF